MKKAYEEGRFQCRRKEERHENMSTGNERQEEMEREMEGIKEEVIEGKED